MPRLQFTPGNLFSYIPLSSFLMSCYGYNAILRLDGPDFLSTSFSMNAEQFQVRDAQDLSSTLGMSRMPSCTKDSFLDPFLQAIY